MYKRILMAADGSREGMVALREGALIAQTYQAKVFLLVIVRETTTTLIADGVHPSQRNLDHEAVLQLGLQRLARLGVEATGQALIGEPAETISAYTRRFKADLLVLGHRKQSLLDRWWSGPSGAYLSDSVGCSVLIARNIISDEEFERNLPPLATPAP